MARPPTRSVEERMIAPESSKKEEECVQVMPLSTKRAARIIKLAGSLYVTTSKGRRKATNKTPCKNLYEILDERQRDLITEMSRKNKKIKKEEPAYVDPRPEGNHIVERVLNSRHRKCVLQYQLPWGGFPLEMAKWESIDDISKLVEVFHKELVGKPGDSVKGRNEYLEQFERKKDEDEKDAVDMGDGEISTTVQITR